MKYVETSKIEDGNVMNWDYHFERAKRTAGIELSLPIVPDGMKQGVIKCRMVYDKEVELIEFLPYALPTIQSLKMVYTTHYFYDKKYTDRSRITSLYAQRDVCDDILIIVDDIVTDTSFCNVVFQNEEGLFTPEHPLLKGTKRALLLDEKRITTRRISVNDLQNYHMAYLINAMIDLENPTTCIKIENIK